MTITSAFFCFLFPCLGSYLASKLFQYKPKPYESSQSKEYKNPFDSEDASTWNYSYARLKKYE